MCGLPLRRQDNCGFSHTHFSGSGHSDLGDFLIMPTQGKLQLNPGVSSDPKSGYRSAFSHQNEVAEAGYYKVKLDDDQILAELTASKRVGMHQYTFPKSDQSHIILDLMSGIYNYEDKNIWTYVRVVNDSLVTGIVRPWLGKNRTVYFAMSISKPFVKYDRKTTIVNRPIKVSGVNLIRQRTFLKLRASS